MKKELFFDFLYKILELRSSGREIFNTNSAKISILETQTYLSREVKFKLYPKVPLTLDVFSKIDELCKKYDVEYKHLEEERTFEFNTYTEIERD